MSHPYDAVTKYLAQDRLADWLPFTGQTTTATLEVIDADVSTVTAAADRVLRVNETPPWLMHLELQSSRDVELPGRLNVYNSLLERQHGLLVRSLVVLLRPAADSPDLTGLLERAFPTEPPCRTFRYRVIRVWQLAPAMLLAAGATIPLAPLGDVTEPQLPGLIQQMDQRIRQVARTPEEIGTLWTAADVLMGLRYERALVDQLLAGVQNMEESPTYQAIVEKGMIKDRHEVLLRQGQKKFGAPSEAVVSAVRSITDFDRLNSLTDRILDVWSWDDLLAVP